jgi:hypothetical protein
MTYLARALSLLPIIGGCTARKYDGGADDIC